MEILELVDGKFSGNGDLDKTDFMNLRRTQPRETVANAQVKHAAEYRSGVDTLIRGLVDMLPNPDSIWSNDDRAKWLRLAAGIFDLGYKAGDSDRLQLRIVVVKPDDPEKATV
jgi:hypothetical protein